MRLYMLNCPSDNLPDATRALPVATHLGRHATLRGSKRCFAPIIRRCDMQGLTEPRLLQRHPSYSYFD